MWLHLGVVHESPDTESLDLELRIDGTASLNLAMELSDRHLVVEGVSGLMHTLTEANMVEHGMTQGGCFNYSGSTRRHRGGEHQNGSCSTGNSSMSKDN